MPRNETSPAWKRLMESMERQEAAGGMQVPRTRIAGARTRIRDLIPDVAEKPDWFTVGRTLRFRGNPEPFQVVWVDVKAGDRTVPIPLYPDKDDPKCPVLKALPDLRRDGEPASIQTVWYWNAIANVGGRKDPKKYVRKNPPTDRERETGFKDKGSQTYTRVRLVKLTAAMKRKIDEDRYLRGGTVWSDPERGRDCYIEYSPEAPWRDRWTITPGAARPLTDKERGYLLYDVAAAIREIRTEETRKQVKARVKDALEAARG